MAENKKGKSSSPSFYIGGISCLLVAWLIIFFSYTIWTGFRTPGIFHSLFSGLVWQAAVTSTPEFLFSFYVLGSVTLAFVTGLIIMAVGNNLPRAIVSVKVAFGMLVILFVPFIQIWTRLGISPRGSFPAILLADAILSVAFLIGFVAFLSIRRRRRKNRE